MRNSPNLKANRHRLREGLYGTTDADGNYGVFRIPQKQGPDLLCLVSEGTCPETPEADGWEHVSVSTAHRCPTWSEMALVKELFWRDDEVVYQLHPARSEHISYHPNCLHLWRRRGCDPPLPPKILVAPEQFAGKDSAL